MPSKRGLRASGERKLYLPFRATRRAMDLLKVIDESGEDYLYPRTFSPVELPPSLRRRCLRAPNFGLQSAGTDSGPRSYVALRTFPLRSAPAKAGRFTRHPALARPSGKRALYRWGPACSLTERYPETQSTRDRAMDAWIRKTILTLAVFRRARGLAVPRTLIPTSRFAGSYPARWRRGGHTSAHHRRAAKQGARQPLIIDNRAGPADDRR